MIKLCTTSVAIFSTLFALTALADAQCATYLDGNTWNLACSADAGDSGDDYQCDYFISLSYSQGDSDQQEATGSVSPGQSGAIIWSEDVNGDGGANIVSADVVSGSCSQ